MKITYKFANFETAEIDVTEEFGSVIINTRREEASGNHEQSLLLFHGRHRF